ncbi:MAG TPA: protein translocase subunit SecD [Solirubrobacteraceae bacterium]|nr:protein translocase subunit SecD [Solirubrobacteraceae bacterium]
MSDRRRNGLVLATVVGLVIISLLVCFGIPGVAKPRKTQLGLDLQGGVELIFQGRASGSAKVDPATIAQAVSIIQARVNSLGVSNNSVTSSGRNEIDVSLAGIKSVQQAEQAVGTTAQLYFYDWEDSVINAAGHIAGPNDDSATGDDATAGDDGGNPGTATNALTEYAAIQRALRQPEITEAQMKPYHLESAPDGTYYYIDPKTKTVLTPGGETAASRAVAKGYLLEDLAQNGRKLPAGAKLVWVKPGTVVRQAQPTTGQAAVFNRHFDHYYVLRDDPAVAGKDVTNPIATEDPTTNEEIVTFGFRGKANSIFYAVTGRLAHRGSNSSIGDNYNFQHFAVTLDQRIITVPYIDFTQNPDGIDPSANGSEISGNFTVASAQALANLLASGALPINLAVISSQQVGATLGHSDLNKGLVAGAAGLLVVALFLLLFYRALGAIAVAALAVYAVYFYALIKLVPITLTLPGIAGLILTIGVAADANVVIFERVKEESRAGRSPINAIAAGYRRGFASIVDANAVTFMTAFILFMLSQSDVKGFAFTLGIGTLVSLFTAVAATRAILTSISHTRAVRRPSALGVRRKAAGWRFDFMGSSRWFFTLSGTILAIGAIAIATRGIDFGIDFVGGTQIEVTFQHRASASQVDSALASIPGAKIQKQLQSPIVQPVSAKTIGTGAKEVPTANTFQISTKTLTPGEIGSATVPGTVYYALDHAFGIKAGNFSSDSVGASFGRTIADAAIIAIIASLLAISAYIALRFEWKYAVPVLIALAHDLLITSGVYALTGKQVSEDTVAALLTILGYSIYDTIIVFDRVRENVKRMQNAAFSQIVNRSMSEVLTRSLATSFCTLLPVLALLLFGGSTLKNFAFALLVGVASGAYSSIFIASPVLTHWKEREPVYRRRRARIAAANGGVVPAYATTGEAARETAIDDAPARRRGNRLTQPDPLGGVSASEWRQLVTDIRPAAPTPEAEPYDPSADARPEDVVMPKDRPQRPRGASKSRSRRGRGGRSR